ncbi:MAG TPA: hypothetical protein VIF62_18165 [Labilithrix sp.]
MRFVVPSAALAAVLSFASVASAVDRAECMASYANGQKLRGAGKLGDARAAYATCADLACPAKVRADCKLKGDAIDKLLPSVVVTAKDEKGADVVDANVEIDGKLVSDRLTGKPVPMDTGAHVIKITPKDGEPLEQKILVVEGEKNRVVNFVVKAKAETTPTPTPTPVEPTPTPVTPTPTPPPKESEDESKKRAHGAAPWIVAGIGLGAVAAGASFLKRAADIQAEVDFACHSFNNPEIECVQDTRKSDAQTAAVVSFIAGGTLLAGGLLWHVLEPVDKPPPPTTAPWILIGAGLTAVVIGGAMATLGAVSTSTDTTTDFLPTGIGVGTAGLSMLVTGFVWKATAPKP